MFAFAITGLVYPQIWEDPVIDLEALEIESHHRLITIASGGCNALSYLVADPAEVIAVDLNASHAALNRLKIAAVRHLPDYDSFFAFVEARIAPATPASSTVTSRRTLTHPRATSGTPAISRPPQIEMFARGFYRYGLLGRFIAAGHLAARLYGRDPRAMLDAKSLPQQREIYARELKPLSRNAPCAQFSTNAGPLRPRHSARPI